MMLKYTVLRYVFKIVVISCNFFTGARRKFDLSSFILPQNERFFYEKKFKRM